MAYQVFFILFAITVVRRCQHYMQKYGTLNEHKRGRDLVPDAHHKRLSLALIIFIHVRNIGVFFLGKDSSRTPSLDIWSPIKVGAFQIALDYCMFYRFYLFALVDSPKHESLLHVPPFDPRV